MSKVKKNIEQSYVECLKKQSIRIRKSQNTYLSGESEVIYTYTFKLDVNKIIEIETEISFEDYLLLKRNSCLTVVKTRYEIDDWEIDFFKTGGGVYFVQAEIELPESQKAPEEIHPLVKKYLIHSVDIGDNRFTSKKLGNIKYAKNLLRNLF